MFVCVLLTSHFGADLHVLQQYCQRLQIFCCPSSLHFCQLAVYLTETLTIQPAHKEKYNYRCSSFFILITFFILIFKTNLCQSYWSLRSVNCFSRFDISSRHSILLRSQSSSSISETAESIPTNTHL